LLYAKKQQKMNQDFDYNGGGADFLQRLILWRKSEIKSSDSERGMKFYKSPHFEVVAAM
jgi:hypothetical protein